MSKPVGIAVMLTMENAEKVAFYNNGVVLTPDERPTVFFIPYDPDDLSRFVLEDEFLKRYRGMEALREDYFIDVYKTQDFPDSPVPYHYRHHVHS